MPRKRAFDSAIRSAPGLAEKTELFGAFLTRSVGERPPPIITGGSAVAILTSGRFVSGDIDVVGRRERIEPVLRRWGFTSENDPDGRVYWTRADLGLFVDILHRTAGRGRSGTPRRIETSAGPVWVTAVEDLLIGRLVRWSRGGAGADEMMDQAVELFVRSENALDLAYLEGEVRYERVGTAYRELRRLVDLASLRGE